MATQIESAQEMYQARAQNYEDSWHPDYSARFVKLIDIRPGDRVLDLCCGTGLDAFLAADLVGDEGEVVGVDITEGMLAQARARQEREATTGRRIKLLRHDVTDLGSLAEVAKGSFDALLCSNAFVLFDNPANVVAAWKDYLKPGGLLVIDIPHEHNMRSGLVMERVAKRMGEKWVSNRSWVTSRDSFRETLEKAGFVVEKIEELNKVTDQRETYYSVDQADEQFDYITKTALSMLHVVTEDFLTRARPVFRDEFASDAVDGKVEIVDSLYVYLARKPQ